MKALDVIFLTSIISVIIALPLWIIFAWPIWASKSKEPPVRWREIIADISTVFFLCGVLIGMVAAATSEDIAKSEVINKLKSFPDDCRISINGDPIRNPKDLLSTLRSIDDLPAHHSSPTKKIQIDVSDNQSKIVLSLARDSNDPEEYWVFYPKHSITKSNEIGRIKTALLDGY